MATSLSMQINASEHIRKVFGELLDVVTKVANRTKMIVEPKGYGHRCPFCGGLSQHSGDDMANASHLRDCIYIKAREILHYDG
jgi:hypothetical protein